MGGGITREEVVSLTGWNTLHSIPINIPQKSASAGTTVLCAYNDYKDAIGDYREIRLRFEQESAYCSSDHPSSGIRIGFRTTVNSTTSPLEYSCFYASNGFGTQGSATKKSKPVFGAHDAFYFVFKTGSYADITNTLTNKTLLDVVLLVYVYSSFKYSIKGTLYIEGRK